MGWIVVPCLLEGRAQLDKRFPNRDKSSEGTIGDTAHQAEASSHNPDLTGHPEYRDGDAVDEVRAWDADKDLRDPSDIQMEQIVQLWLTKLRAGKMSWIRYLIYNGRIWHRRDNFVTHVYTGSNKHTDHVHVNSDFTQTADTVTNTYWYLDELGNSTPVANPPTTTTPAPTPPQSSSHVVQKGDKGTEVTHIQTFFRDVFPAYRWTVTVKRGQLIGVDGDFGDQTEAWVKLFQKKTMLKQDGIVGPITAAKMKRYGYKY